MALALIVLTTSWGHREVNRRYNLGHECYVEYKEAVPKMGWDGAEKVF